MKVGVLTYHAVYNFGANLQVYSTISFLKNQGYDPLVINWIPLELEKGYNRSIPSVQADMHKEFIQNNLPVSELCRTDEDIIKVIKNHKLDGIIIGSDAVLQHKSFLTRISISWSGIKVKEKRTNVVYPNPYWGSFLDLLDYDFPVVVMSASSQNSNYYLILFNLKRRIRTSLRRFKLITVRDVWTRKMVAYLTNNQIIPDITPDPVFNFNQNVKNQLTKAQILNKFGLCDGYLLLSFNQERSVSESWIKEFDNLAQSNNLNCVLLAMPKGIIYKNLSLKSVPLPLDPVEWYSLIKYSSGYIGENMHPVVVALHNSVPFFSFDTYGIVRLKYFVNEKSSKIFDILQRAGYLDNRISVVGKNYVCPSPQEVLTKVLEFDRAKCDLFSLNQSRDYDVLMKKTISALLLPK